LKTPKRLKKIEKSLLIVLNQAITSFLFFISECPKGLKAYLFRLFKWLQVAAWRTFAV